MEFKKYLRMFQENWMSAQAMRVKLKLALL